MRSIGKTLLAASLGLLSLGQLHAQGTFDKVYSILQSNCTSCHGGTSPIAFDLGTTPAETYAAIVGVDPLNPSAAAKGHKLIDPGHPYNSFLLKKVGANLDGYFNLEAPFEGNPMPGNGAPSLSAYDAEMIRQWILTGANATGTQVDTALIYNYYASGGQGFQTPPSPPAAGQGFQIRLGPIFLPPNGNAGSEVEYLKKEHLQLDSDKEVIRIEGDLNPQSHHFLLFKWDDSLAASNYADGLRLVNILNVATDGNKSLQNTWQYDHTLDLPNGTAFYYNQDDWLDLNYHIKNYSSTDILPADFYLNVHTIQRGSGRKEMRARLVNNANLFLLPGTNNVSMTDTWGGDDRQIWVISSHTHKYGTDFDIFVKDSLTGQRGEQIYEGFYDTDYIFNQGFYDWEHPAMRRFDSLYTVRSNQGLIFDTKYNNTSGNLVTFGLTTNDEMQLSTYLYVNKNEVVAVSKPEGVWDPYHLSLFPNPSTGSSLVDFGGVARSGSYQVVDVNGKVLSNTAFKRQSQVPIELSGVAAGIYQVVFQFEGGKQLSRKLMIQ